MVDASAGQFYTMEGIAAAVLMVLTAYFVMSGTTMYTPGDSHIIDMQLEQLGNDALKIMDTKNTASETESFSQLESCVRSMKNLTSKTNFNNEFSTLINTASEMDNDIQFEADIYYINETNAISKYDFTQLSRKFSGNENGIRVTRWVFVDYNAPSSNLPDDFRVTTNQTVLFEVLLWRN